jgi:hypothetical protein
VIEMGEDEITTEDEQLLERVGLVISGSQNWEGEKDPRSLDALFIELVSVRAEADDAFRKELLARLQDEMQAQVLQRSQVTEGAAPGAQKLKNVEPSAEVVRREKEKVRSGGAGKTFSPQHSSPAGRYHSPGSIKASKAARFVLSFAGIAVLMVMLVSMALILRARSDVNTLANRTPIAEPAPPTETSLVSGLDLTTTTASPTSTAASVALIATNPPVVPVLTNCAAWSVLPSHSEGTLNSVAAIAGDDVWAVGHTGVSLPSESSEPVKTLVQHWNGKDWRVIPSPNISVQDNRLYGVAALSHNDVWAVGAYGNYEASKTLTMHWNGVQWRVVASPDGGSGANTLSDVAAIAPDNIWAVGSYATCNDPPSCSSRDSHTLILHWNGKTWRIVPSPNPGTSGGALNAVAAISGSDIWAVGSYGDKVKYDTYEYTTPKLLFLHWNGKVWSQVAGPANGEGGRLTSIAAISSSDVWAVGGFWGGEPDVSYISVHWDGRAWTENPLPRLNGGTMGGWNSVAASSSNDVWLAGWGWPTTRWNGSGWTSARSPQNDSWLDKQVLDMAAVAPSEIWAVGGTGYYRENEPDKSALILRYGPAPCITHTPTSSSTPSPTNSSTPTNTPTETPTATRTPLIPATFSVAATVTTACGVWTTYSGSNLGDGGSVIEDIAVLSADDIWAVGHYNATHDTVPLILHWDGNAWTHMLSPRPMLSYGTLAPDQGPWPSRYMSLNSIDALSRDDVWAFGSYSGAYEGEENLPLTLHWDGKAWRIVSASMYDPSIRAHRGAVARISEDDAWAAGPGWSISRWNGNFWRGVPLPNIGPSNRGSLLGISAASKDDVWAYGSYIDTPNPAPPVPVSTGAPPIGAPTSTPAPTPRPWPWRYMLLHWDGRMWAEVQIPGLDPYATILSDLQAISNKEVWVSGSLREGKRGRPLVLRWDGANWTQVIPPDPGSPDDAYTRVEVASTGNVWAASQYFRQGSGPSQTHLFHWNGREWTAIFTPRLELSGAKVALTSKGVWFAGSISQGDSSQKALIARYSGSPCPGP